MHKPSLCSVVLLSAVSFVSASDICAYTSRNCLPTTFGCCSNIPQTTCCYWPNNYGWSVKFQNMPSSPWAGSVSQNDVCTSVYNGSTYLNWLSANWNAGTLISRDDANCVRPNVIGFTTEVGEEHLVKVPEGKFDELNEWVKTGSFSKLLVLDSI
ncbi:uncharacterized protein LACBIDRAFT_292408 [Laccaria bicolor S238N-H82]|uniref:Predicted protein n=1 Tax=Laccaria bicolor (strain S238N-H82 / ATCC MYA-4686) TaxID=486041 RepID=B0CWX0_LACBS|nr:uncharacterized protein LACBIDRAFT_292408 [Laccaria bicolor S238N-H82]EDR13579.1 predicted protein [Laccaria bicolor S238N-H82]|eukprot:XP_001876077.1 predicted protein [Laccaria bicolor S238N-H82]